MRATLIILVALSIPAIAGAPAFAQGATAGQASPAPAQTPPPASPPSPAAPVEQGATARPSPLEPKGYTYEPENRRDPFVSLVRRGQDQGTGPADARPAGLAGVATSELALTGTIRGTSGAWLALMRGVDRKTWMVRAGDRLLDGTISRVTANAVVILQQVNDPLSLATQREVRKVLRQTDEAK